jgi:RNA polymerase sigma-70 factor, ECF subfamily
MTWDPETSDAALVLAWRGGDKAAADVLIRRYGPRLYNFFAGKVGRGADELCQQTLHDCLTATEPPQGDGSGDGFRGLLFAAARRRLLDHYRASARTSARAIDPLEQSLADLEPGMSEAVAAREDQRRLALVLRRLPLDFQVALELLHWEGLDVAEIGRVVEAPAGTIETRLARAHTLLQGLLDERDDAPAEHTVEASMTEVEPRSR